MPSFNYAGISSPSTAICGSDGDKLQNNLFNGTWGNNLTAFTCTKITNTNAATKTFYINNPRIPVTVLPGATLDVIITNVWNTNSTDLCLLCEPCPCDADMMAPMTSGAGTGKTQTTGTRWGPDGEDQTGAWYSGNTQYTRLGVGGVNN
jgi:hypothetical protein